MRHHPFVLLTALIFTMVACSGSDDATTTPTDPQTTDTEAVTDTVATTPPTEATTTFEDNTITPTTSDGPTGQVEVFSFAEHDLCEWITAEEMAEFVAAEYDWEGAAHPAHLARGERVEGDAGIISSGCIWLLTGADPAFSPHVRVEDPGEFDYSGPVPYDPDPAELPLDAMIVGNPALSDGVAYKWGGFGWNAIGFPEDDRFIQLSVLMPDADLGDDSWFGLADRIIERLGWSEDPTSQADVFSFADDDLCEWVTQEEIAGFIAESFDWNGTLIEQPTPEPDNCAWELVGNGNGWVSVNDAGGWETFGGNPVDWGAEDIVEFSNDDPDYVEIGSTVSDHPALSDGVVVHNAAFGQYAFWVPPRQEYLAFSLDVPGVDNMFEADRFFMVADQIIRELGWVD